MIRKAKAVWVGTGQAGYGDLATDSGVLNRTPYSIELASEVRRGPPRGAHRCGACWLLHHGARFSITERRLYPDRTYHRGRGVP